MPRSTYPLPASPGDIFVWGAWKCSGGVKGCRTLWITPLSALELRSSVCLRCRRKTRYWTRPWWWVSRLIDLPLVGETTMDWALRKLRQHAEEQAALRAEEQVSFSARGDST